MSVTTDFPDWSPHVATADQVAATGVPLLTKSVRLYQQVMSGISAGSTAGSGVLSVSQIGYEIDIGIQVAAGATVPFAKVELQWTDSGTGSIVATDDFFVPTATDLGGFEIFGHGPTKADQVELFITNLDPVQQMTAAPILLQNSRIYQHDIWRWANAIDATVTVPGWTLASLIRDESVLGIVSSGAVPASGNKSWLFGIGYGGWVNLAGTIAGPAASAITVTVFGTPSTQYGGGGIVQRVALTTAAFNFAFHAPRTSLQIEVSNTATTAATVSMMATVSP